MEKLSEKNIPLERDVFVRDLLRHLTGALESVIGLEEASGFVSVVGQKMGESINSSYKQALGVKQLSREQVADVLVDLKQRIKGDFSIVSQDDDKLVLRNTKCPFEDKVLDRPSLCMMTSNVFGTIASDNLGYAKVELTKTIARGDPGCLVTVYLRDGDESRSAEGHEYFKS